MEKIDKKTKAIKAYKSLKQLFIGQVLCIVGIFSELSFLSDYIELFVIAAIVGIVFMIIGISRMYKANGYFLTAFISGDTPNRRNYGDSL